MVSDWFHRFINRFLSVLKTSTVLIFLSSAHSKAFLCPLINRINHPAKAHGNTAQEEANME
jgi:hypothetical protein